MNTLRTALLTSLLVLSNGAFAALISVSNTTTGIGSGMWTTDYSIEFNDADANLTLTMAELIGISWVQTGGGSTTTGTSDPIWIGLGGFDFVVSSAGVVSATNGFYSILTTHGDIGLQAFGPAEPDRFGHFGACAVSCGPDVRLDTFTVSGVVPIPAAAWLFGSGLIGLAGLKRRQRS